MSRSEREVKCGTPSDECLCRELLRLYEAKELPLYRGKVARNPLQSLLGFPAGSLLASSRNSKHAGVRQCIERFDGHLRRLGHGTVWEEKVPKVRAFLERASRKGSLPVNSDGRLNRRAVLMPFGLGRGSPYVIQSRAPLMKDLLDEYEGKANASGQEQYKYARHEGALRRALARDDLQLTHGRQVSLSWLARKIGIPAGAMAYTPCLKAAVEEKQAEVDAALRAGTSSKTVLVGGAEHPNLGPTPFSEAHGRVFSFAELVDAYGLPFTERLATAFILVVADLAIAKASHSRIRHFLRWLAERSQVEPEVPHALRANAMPPKAAFERAVLTYRQEVLGELDRQGRRHRHPSLSVIEQLGHLGVFPEISLPRRKRDSRKGLRNSAALPSLAEAQIVDEGALARVADLPLPDEAEFARGGDARAFINSLALERERRSELPEALPDAIRVICEERIDALREAASAIYVEWRRDYEQGKRLLERARPGEEIGDALEARLSRGDRNKLVDRLFPRADPELAMANLLSLIRARHGGVCPAAASPGGGLAWGKAYAKVGGQRQVQRLLLPPRLVVSAVACLYLCESGANVAVALSLSNRALRPSRKGGHMDVIGNKARAGGKPVYNTLSKRSSLRTAVSAVEAMEQLQDAVAACRKLDEAAAGRLFVHPTRGRMSSLEEFQLREDTARIVADSELASYKVLPSMVRPTVLLAMQLRNPGNLGAAQLLAQHESPSTTNGYVNKLPHQVILQKRVGKFAVSLEDKILATDGSQAWQAPSANEKDTGMGVLCGNAMAGAQPDYPAGTQCRAVERCASCPQMVVAASPQSIALMIIWRDALVKAEPHWLAHRHDRWEKIWLSWVALYHVVLDQKMARGPLAGVRKKAEDLAEEIKRRKGFRMPEPF